MTQIGTLPRLGMDAACREPITIAAAVTAVAAVAGAGMQVVASQRQAAVQRGQAAQADFAAEGERIKGVEQGNQLRDNLLRTLAAQRSRYAASGLLADEGTAMTLQEQTAARAERELTIQDANATIRSEQGRAQASLLDDSADWTATAGYARGGINLFETAGRAYERWPGTAKPPGKPAGATQ
jgi:hypothetical protein